MLNPKSSIKTKYCRLCLLKNSSKFTGGKKKSDSWCHWLSGFTAGEGNFSCHKDGAGGFVFRINLREDDLPILQEIKDNLGVGDLYFRDIKKNIKNWNPKYQTPNMQNQWTYNVNSVYDLVNYIVPFFDKYPIRAKKNSQYKIWKTKLLNRYIYLFEGKI